MKPTKGWLQLSLALSLSLSQSLAGSSFDFVTYTHTHAHICVREECTPTNCHYKWRYFPKAHGRMHNRGKDTSPGGLS